MKKFLSVLLAFIMVFTMVPVTALALSDDFLDDHDNQDIFTIKENTGTLSPGVDYYFDCKWGKEDITDEFFEFYDVSVSINTPFDRDDKDDDDYISQSTARKIGEVAEFVKLDGGDKYYFHFRAKKTFNYPADDEVTIDLTVLAKDKSRDKKRDDSYSWYEFDLDIGYADKNDVKEVNGNDYEVDNDRPIVEFDEDLDYCKLTFEDGSYYRANLDRVRKFNFGQSTDENLAIKSAYPNAKLKFVSFYANPRFPSSSVLKISAPGCNYLYEINSNNTLTLLATGNNDGFIGVTTNELSTYVASDIELSGNIAVSSGNYVNSNTVTTPVSPSASANNAAAVVTPPSTVVITNPNTGAN